MKTLLLIAGSIFTAGAAPQSAPTASTTAVPRPSSDAPRSLKIIELRETLKSDVDTLNFSTGVFTTVGRSWKPITDKEQPAAPATSAPTTPRADDSELIAKRASEWQDMLVHWIQPALIVGHDTLQLTRDGTLIANLTADAHAWLDRFLALQRETRAMVAVEVTFITCPREMIDRFASAGNPCVISAEDAKQLRADARRGGIPERISPARLIGWVRVWNQVSVLDSSNYVKDWTITTVEPGHREVAVPQIGTVDDGNSVDVRAVPLDATHVRLEIDASRSTVMRPIETKKVKLAIEGEREVEIALPEVNKVRLKSQISLEYGGYALFCGMDDGDNRTAVLVHVERDSHTSKPEPGEVILKIGGKGSKPDKH
jgi:hypothetical protein